MAQGPPIVGQVLGHYRVLEQIGAGGMGMVFRASDQQLERDVAIKVLPPGMLADESARKRFRGEALTLAKLNHPNIGTVYEFGSQGEVDFLVMEYVGGAAIDAKLGSGPLSQKELLRFGFQLADGLASAHDHGVIHRDLKPANLRLTHDNRLKILDFGLAQFVKPASDMEVTASVSEKQVTGTLPYMAPEQLRAERVDERSDVWSAGVVLYELATGRRPFGRSHAPLLIDAILNKAVERPTVLNPKISPGLEAIILKCLDKDPERRYQSARELRVDLDRLSVPVSTAPSSTPSSPWDKLRSPAFFAGGLLLVLLGAFLYWRFRATPVREAGPQAVMHRRTVAVLNPKNSTSRTEAAWISIALPEMLTTELAAGGKLRVVTGDQVSQMKMSLALPDSDALTPQTLSQVGKALGADLVVLGSYMDLPNGKLRLDLHLQDVATGETLIAVKQMGEETDLSDLVTQAGAQLREKCDAGQVDPQEMAAVRAALPSNPEASRLYAQGLAKLRVNDAIAARDLLQKAVAADPNHALAHSALAAAWSLLGYDEKARLSAKSAYDLSTSLSREDRLLTEARYREFSKEWDNAAKNYRTLFDFFSDNIEYGLLLARAQTRGGKGKEALVTVESMRRLPPPSGDDARIDLAASEAWRSLGDFKQSQDLASRAAEKARAQSARVLLARALYQRGFALEKLGDANGAIAAVQDAANIYKSVGDRYGFASTLEVTAQVFEDRSDYPAALAKFNSQLGIAREIGNRKAESSALNNMGFILNQQGNGSEARKMFEKALNIFREVSDKSNYAQTLINIANSMSDEGSLSEAEKTYDQALAVFREINNQNGIALSLAALGTVEDAKGESAKAAEVFKQAIALELASGQPQPSSDKLIALGDALQHVGNLADARKNYQDAVELARAANDKSVTAYGLMGLGSLELKSADFTQARRDYDEALAFRKELGEQDNVATTQVAIAELVIEEGNPAAAEGPAREARGEFQQARKTDDQVNAAVVLVDALLAEGKNAAAFSEIAKAAPIAARTQNLAVDLKFAISRARTKVAAGDRGAAEAIVNEALAKAKRSGYRGDEFECRLAIEQIDLKSAKSQGSRIRLQKLQEEAKDKGFNLIARKAAAL